MKDLITILAIALFSAGTAVSAQEKNPQETPKKECSTAEKKSCETSKKSCCESSSKKKA